MFSGGIGVKIRITDLARQQLSITMKESNFTQPALRITFAGYG